MPFPMPPGLRIPYDVDGTLGVLKQAISLGGELFDVHPNALKGLNGINEGGMYVPNTIWANGPNGSDYYEGRSSGDFSGGSGPNGMSVTLIFPVPTRLRGIFHAYTAGPGTSNRDNNGIYLQTSKNSTNAVDGDWSPVYPFSSKAVPRIGASHRSINAVDGSTRTGTNDYRPIRSYYRNVLGEAGATAGISDLAGQDFRNVKALRIFPRFEVFDETAAGPMFVHLYGEPDAQALGTDHLQAWRADSDMRLGGATLSWGDVALGSSSDKAFRLKNQSAVHTANAITIYAEGDLFTPTPLPSAQFTFSLDGGDTWATSVVLGAIGPGSISPEILIRRVTPLGASLASWSPKVRFDVGSWS